MSTIPLLGLKARVANLLFELTAIKFGSFKLKLHEKYPDAPKSPIFLMLRTADHPKNPGPLTPEAMREIGELLREKIASIKFKYFVGIPEAGEPFADQVERITRGWRRPRPRRLTLKKETFGDKRRITKLVNWFVWRGRRVLVIDDLITQADTKLEAIQALVSRGLVIAGVLVLVDRQQGGRPQLEKAGYQLYAVFTLDELLDHYAECGYITASKAKKVRDYIAANQVA